MSGTDTNSFDLEPQAIGLRQFLLDFHLTTLMMIKNRRRPNTYEALFNWANFVWEEKHNWNPQR